MSVLDFLIFKEFEVNASVVCNELGSGGWEVILTQGAEKVVITSQQLDRINKKIQDYIAESLEMKSDQS
jgi:hypothetical protein